MRFRCVNGITVLQRLEGRKKIGLIELPDSAVKTSETARVLECCPKWIEDGKERETTLTPGDFVCISKYAGQEFEINGNGMGLNIVLVRERDILCILDEVENTSIQTTPTAAVATSSVPIISAAAPKTADFSGPAGVWGDGISEDPLAVSA